MNWHILLAQKTIRTKNKIFELVPITTLLIQEKTPVNTLTFNE